MGVPDTAHGRFELYSLHVILVLHRLKARGEAAEETAQALFDTYLKSLDDALREQGVGDLSMSKNMRRLGEAFYGRVRSYDAALGDPEALRALIRRTVYEDKDGPAELLAAYAERSVETLAAQPDEAVLRGELRWPAPAT
jgi:cytochrome b pre-mRNA-processing protein 3